MTTRHRYSKAPITEAIIDLRVSLPETVGLGHLERLHEQIRADYPEKANRSLAHGRIEVGKSVSASASSKPRGFLFKSEDGKQIFQAQLDGFTMNRLAPYDRWEPFRDEARHLWTLYRNAVCPDVVVRLAVRYINRIDIPMPFNDLNEYLRTFPEVSSDLPQQLSGLFMQLRVPHDDIRSVALLTEALSEPSKPDVASIILDIDLFRTEDVPTDDESIWDFFEVLHERKNDIFEACITDKTRELID